MYYLYNTLQVILAFYVCARFNPVESCDEEWTRFNSDKSGRFEAKLILFNLVKKLIILKIFDVPPARKLVFKVQLRVA